MDSSLDAAIRAVAPTLGEPFPQSLRQATERLYAASKQKISLKPKEEAARYHLCAYVAVLKDMVSLKLTAPATDNIPLNKKSATELVLLFKKMLLPTTDGSVSAHTSNVSTPKKAKEQPNSTTTTPQSQSPSGTRRPGRPPGAKNKTPLMRRLEAAAGSPSKRPASPLQNFMSSGKKLKMDTNALPDAQQGGDTVASPSAAVAYQDHHQHLLLLTSREITALCNKFQIPQETTRHVVETFQQYSEKVSNEWILICGLVVNCYYVINHSALAVHLGSKSTVVKTMFSLQNGGLMLNEVHSSVEMVRNLIEYSRWFKKLKLEYNYPIDETISILNSGTMISPRYQFHSKQNQEKYQEWKASIYKELEIRKEAKKNKPI